jgi:hypothetical protein
VLKLGRNGDEKEASTEKGLPWSCDYHTTSSHIVRYCLVRNVSVNYAIPFSDPVTAYGGVQTFS